MKVMINVLSLAKSVRTTGSQPKIHFEQGLRLTYERPLPPTCLTITASDS